MDPPPPPVYPGPQAQPEAQPEQAFAPPVPAPLLPPLGPAVAPLALEVLAVHEGGGGAVGRPEDLDPVAELAEGVQQMDPFLMNEGIVAPAVAPVLAPQAPPLGAPGRGRLLLRRASVSSLDECSQRGGTSGANNDGQQGTGSPR